MFKTSRFLMLAIVLRGQAMAVDESITKYQAGEKLDYISIEIEGQQRQVQVTDGQSISVVKGDRFRIVSATLRDRSLNPTYLNVVGFVPSGSKPGEISDGNHWISTASDLNPAWSIKKKGKSYLVKAGSKGVEHGGIQIDLIDPELKYLNASINGQTRLIRNGDFLILKGSDQFKVEKVLTNIENDLKEVGVEFAKLQPSHSSASSSQFLEIRLLRESIVFAKIAVRVDD